MSTEFITNEKISIADLFDGRLERFEIREQIDAPDTSDVKRCLTDGRNHLWVYAEFDGTVCSITRYGANAPRRILEAIAKIFDTDIFSEYEPQYWGFDTQEEWDRSWNKMAEKHDAEFYVELMKYVKGEPNNLKPGTIGMIEANIAKGLIDENPDLASPSKKAELIEAIDRVYQADHAVVVTLDTADIAASVMFVTDERDLPQA